MDNKWISVIIFVVSSVIALLLSYFIPLKVSNKTKMIWVGIAIICSFIIFSLLQVTTIYVAITGAIVIGLAIVFLLWKKGIGQELQQPEATSSSEEKEFTQNSEPEQQMNNEQNIESIHSSDVDENQKIDSLTDTLDEVTVDKEEVRNELNDDSEEWIIEPLTLQNQGEDSQLQNNEIESIDFNVLNEDDQANVEGNEKVAASMTSELAADKVAGVTTIDFEEIEIADIEEVPSVEIDLKDLEQGDSEVVVSEEIETQPSSASEEVFEVGEMTSELAADQDRDETTVDFMNVEMPEVEEEPKLANLELKDFEQGDTEIVVNEAVEIGEMTSELDADKEAGQNTIRFGNDEIADIEEPPSIEIDLEDFEQGDSEVVVSEEIITQPSAPEEVFEVGEMTSELDADKETPITSDFGEVEMIENEEDSPLVEIELEDFTMGDTEVVVNEEIIPQPSGENTQVGEMTSELEADKEADETTIDFSDVKINSDEEEIGHIDIELKDFEQGDSEVVVNEEYVLGEMTSELDADKEAKDSQIDFGYIEREEKEEESLSVEIELEDFEQGDTEVVVNEELDGMTSELELETHVLENTDTFEMTNKEKESLSGEFNNFSSDDLEIVNGELVEHNESHSTRKEQSEREELKESEDLTKNMKALFFEQLTILKQIDKEQFEKTLLGALRKELDKDTYLALSMQYIEYLKEENRIEECIAFLNTMEDVGSK
ncbi:MAG TPA: hypothetical protein VLA13_04095 [Massilibacterium sp.]|nr:hypothetical protein [Massilibacterium sp.]